jgi:hypothetical protein
MAAPQSRRVSSCHEPRRKRALYEQGLESLEQIDLLTTQGDA